MNDQSAIDEFIAWGKERAFEFGNDVGTQLWHSLPQIEEADVIGIGECDHYVSERLDVRLALADVLVPGGFSSFGFERGVSDGFRIDRFLRTASMKWLDRVGALGYREDQIAGRDDDSDPFVGRWSPDRIATARAEERWFYEQLSRFPGARAFGFDMDMVPGGIYQDILDFGNPQASIETELARIPNESLDEEIERVSRVLIELAPQAWTTIATESLVQSLLVSRAFRQGATGMNPTWIALLRNREKLMAKRVRFSFNDTGKCLLFGHNEHLAKDPASMSLAEVGKDRVVMPETLAQLLVDDGMRVVTIWFLFNEGDHFPHPFDPSPSDTVEADPTRIESSLAQIGDRFVLPLSGDMPTLLAEWTNYWSGGYNHSCVLSNQADAIVFMSNVTAPGIR